MSKNRKAAILGKMGLILTFLAVISIFSQPMFSQKSLGTEIKNKTKYAVAQDNLCKSQNIIDLFAPKHLQQKNDFLLQNAGTAIKEIPIDLNLLSPIEFKTPKIAEQEKQTSETEQKPTEATLAKVENKEKEESVEGTQQKEEEIKVSRIMTVTVTAFSSTVDQTDSTPFITANGTHVHDGTIAANFLKFGTRVKFPDLYGDKIFIVEDRMKSNTKVDIWFPTRQEAKIFGVKRLKMEILQD